MKSSAGSASTDRVAELDTTGSHPFRAPATYKRGYRWTIQPIQLRLRWRSINLPNLPDIMFSLSSSERTAYYEYGTLSQSSGTSHPATPRTRSPPPNLSLAPAPSHWHTTSLSPHSSRMPAAPAGCSDVCLHRTNPQNTLADPRSERVQRILRGQDCSSSDLGVIRAPRNGSK
jgi:hypothetical protein